MIGTGDNMGSPHVHRALSRECWRATLPFASACTMATNSWCRWGSGPSSSTSRESWMDLEVSCFFFFYTLSTEKHFTPLESISPHTPHLSISGPRWLTLSDVCDLSSPYFDWFRDVAGQEWAAEDSHLYGPLPRDGSNVCEAICWYRSTLS